MADVYFSVVKFPRDGMPVELMPLDWYYLANAQGYALDLARDEMEACTFSFSGYDIFEGTKAEAIAFVADYNR
jgi:hypothetical protein